MANAMVEEEMEIPMKVRVTLLDCQLCGKACMHALFSRILRYFSSPRPKHSCFRRVWWSPME